MDNLPLVSVPVVTYNSSKYVLETLESIKAQTYQNIELIVSDDCSTDNTVKICRKWIEENANRFVRTELITSPTNTGISANLNRAEAACTGEWVKPIAGDDLLLPDCIKSFYEFVRIHSDAYFVFSKIEIFGGTQEQRDFFAKYFDESFFSCSPEEQYNWLVFKNNNAIPASSFFYNLNHSRELGIVNDERIPLLEDWPKWINILKKGEHFSFLNKETVCYRMGGICNASSSLRFAQSNRLFYWYYLFPERYSRNPEKTIEEVKEYEMGMFSHWVFENKTKNTSAYKAYDKIRVSFVKIKSLFR